MNGVKNDNEKGNSNGMLVCEVDIHVFNGYLICVDKQ
jgi:hypothetical protein